MAIQFNHTGDELISFDSGKVRLQGSATGTNAIAVGSGAASTNTGTIVIGNNASAGSNLGTNAIAIGTGAFATNPSSVAIGLNSAANGSTGSVAIGHNANTTSALHSIALGADSLVNQSYSVCFHIADTNSISGYYVFGHVQANTLGRGRHQRSDLMLQVATTSTAATRLTSTGVAGAATNQLTLRNNSAFRPGQIDIVAYDTVAGTATAWSINNVLIKRGANAGTTALVGTPTVTTVQNDMATAPTVTVSADTTNGALAITVQSATANTTRYTAIIRTSEVMA